jgi:hypothetical protein
MYTIKHASKFRNDSPELYQARRLGLVWWIVDNDNQSRRGFTLKAEAETVAAQWNSEPEEEEVE